MGLVHGKYETPGKIQAGPDKALNATPLFLKFLIKEENSS